MDGHTISPEYVFGYPMEDALHGAQFFCSVVTVAFFLTSTFICLRIKREKSVRDINFLPFVLTFLNCLLWTSYGYTVRNWVIVGVNLSGMIIQAGCIIMYLRFVTDGPTKSNCLRKILGASLVYVLVCIIVYLSPAGVSHQLFGITCNIVTILMFASPLSTMGDVLRNKNTSSMSFLQSLMMFIVSSSWLFFGYLISDMYVKVPNALGAFLGAIQLVLFIIFPSVDTVMQKK